MLVIEFSILNVVIAVSCLLFSSIFRGLKTIYQIEDDILELATGGYNATIAEQSKKIINLKSWGNILPAALIIVEVTSSAGFVVVMIELFGSLFGFLFATAGLVLFGNLVPYLIAAYAPFSLGATFALPLKAVMVLIYPLAWFLGKISEGHQLGVAFDKMKVAEMFDANRQVGTNVFTMMLHTSGITKLTAKDLMTSIDQVFKLDYSTKFTFPIMKRIFKSSFSLLPVVDRNIRGGRDNFKGALFTKDLILLDPLDQTPLSTVFGFYGEQLPRVDEGTSVSEILEELQSHSMEAALVTKVSPGELDDEDPFRTVVGLVTLNDIFQHLLQLNKEDSLLGLSNNDPNNHRLLRGDLFVHTGGARLSQQEAAAVFLHLSQNVRPFQRGNRAISDAGLRKLIENSLVVEVEKDTEVSEEVVEHHVTTGGHMVYQRGFASSTCAVMLSGRLEIKAGKNQFKSVQPRWSVLASSLLNISQSDWEDRPQEVLQKDNWVADFDAHILETSRILLLRRAQLLEILAEEQPPPESCLSKVTGRLIQTPSPEQKLDEVLAEKEKLRARSRIELAKTTDEDDIKQWRRDDQIHKEADRPDLGDLENEKTRKNYLTNTFGRALGRKTAGGGGGKVKMKFGGNKSVKTLLSNTSSSPPGSIGIEMADMSSNQVASDDYTYQHQQAQTQADQALSTQNDPESPSEPVGSISITIEPSTPRVDPSNQNQNSADSSQLTQLTQTAVSAEQVAAAPAVSLDAFVVPANEAALAKEEGVTSTLEKTSEGSGADVDNSAAKSDSVAADVTEE